jgi:hypothetical protein
MEQTMQEQQANNIVPSLQDAATAVAPPLCMLVLMEAFAPFHSMISWLQ